MKQGRDDMPVPKRPGKPSRSMRAWPSVTALVCVIFTFPLVWFGARAHDGGVRRHVITLVVLVGIPAVVWTVLGCSASVRARVQRIALRAHLIPADAAGRRIAAVLPVSLFAGSYIWWVMLVSGGLWSLVAVLAIFAVPALPMVVDPDYQSAIRPH